MRGTRTHSCVRHASFRGGICKEKSGATARERAREQARLDPDVEVNASTHFYAQAQAQDIQTHLSRSLMTLAGKYLQQCRLAASRRTHDCHERASINRTANYMQEEKKRYMCREGSNLHCK